MIEIRLILLSNFKVDPVIQNGLMNSSRTSPAINSIDLNLHEDNEYESITTYR